MPDIETINEIDIKMDEMIEELLLGMSSDRDSDQFASRYNKLINDANLIIEKIGDPESWGGYRDKIKEDLDWAISFRNDCVRDRDK